MKVERSLKVKERSTSKIRNIISMAIHFQKTQEELLKDRTEFIKNLPPKTPQWLKSYLDGYWEAKMDLIHDCLEFCYKVDGKLYSIVKNSSRYYGKKMSPKELNDKQETSGFYWKDTDKPYFLSKDN